MQGEIKGQLLAGKYRVERVLGQGGMGIVVAAHHIVLDETVAIKFLLPAALQSTEAVVRFEREARAAVKIKSEHVARVTDVGRLETGAPYMVMELLRGRDLGQLLQQGGPLRLDEVADYILQAGEAIAEAHSLGIVHRDLKPANLFLTQRADGSSCIKVLDFGISKLTTPGRGEQGMTSTTAVMGSPLYMSPEQLISARDVDMRTDIWALGVVCFELLTGKLPFLAETLPQLCMAISLAPPTRLRTYRPDLPEEAEAMLLRCLTKDPRYRLASVAELAAELVQFAPTARVSAERIQRLARGAGFYASHSAEPAPPRITAVPTETNNQTITEFGRTRPASSSTKVQASLGLVAVLVVGSAGAYAWVHSTVTPVTHPLSSSSTASSLAAPSASTTPSWAGPSPATSSSAVPSASAQSPGVSSSDATRPPPVTPTAAVTAVVVRPPVTAAAGRWPLVPASPIVQSANIHGTPSSKVDCAIPYFFDERGNKVFKKGCVK